MLTLSNPVTIGAPTKKSHYDAGWDNTFYLYNYLLKTGPFVDAREFASINAAVAAIGITPATLIVSEAETLTGASLTILSTLSLIIIQGGSIIKASTYILTINGDFAGCDGCFVGFAVGDVTFGPYSTKEPYAAWWQPNTTPGTTDMTLAVQSAAASLDHTITGEGGIISLSGINLITSTLTYATANATPWYNLTMKGISQGTELRWGGAANGTLFRTGPIWYCHFKDILFNGNSLADFAVNFGGISGGEGVSQGDTWKNCHFAYAKYGFALAVDANVAGLLSENCSYRNNSYAGFAPGSLNGDLMTFNRCTFNNNAFGIASMMGTGAETLHTSIITGVGYTFAAGNASLGSQNHTGCMFIQNTEADIYGDKIDESVVLIGCGGEGSRTLYADGAIFGATPNNSNANQTLSFFGCSYHGFGTVADVLNDPFILIQTGSNLNIQGFKLIPELIYPRTGIDINNGQLNIQSTFFDLNANITAWPDILSYAVGKSPSVSSIFAQNLMIRRNDLGSTYDKHWLVPIYTFSDHDVTPSVGIPKVPIYKTANTVATIITTFDNGTSGQEILIIFTDAFTTVAETDNIKLSAAFTSSADDTMRLIYDGTSWFEISRSVN